MAELATVSGIMDLAIIVAERINREKWPLVLIDGITCTGKTSLARSLSGVLAQRGHPATLLSTDMFLIDRDARNYRDDQAMKDLWNWYDHLLADRVVGAICARQPSRISELVYDRSTGRADHLLDIDVDAVHSTTIFEGFSSTRLLMTRKGCLTRPLRIYLYCSYDVIRKRVNERNTYISSERREYEMREIYYPSFVNYVEMLRSRGDKYHLICNTARLESILVRENATPPPFT